MCLNSSHALETHVSTKSIQYGLFCYNLVQADARSCWREIQVLTNALLSKKVEMTRHNCLLKKTVMVTAERRDGVHLPHCPKYCRQIKKDDASSGDHDSGGGIGAGSQGRNPDGGRGELATDPQGRVDDRVVSWPFLPEPTRLLNLAMGLSGQ